jgi:hypothetical protein
MRRIRGLVRTVMAIAGAVNLNSPMMGMAAAGSERGVISEMNGLEGAACKSEPPAGVDQSVAGEIGTCEGDGSCRSETSR